MNRKQNQNVIFCSKLFSQSKYYMLHKYKCLCVFLILFFICKYNKRSLNITNQYKCLSKTYKKREHNENMGATGVWLSVYMWWEYFYLYIFSIIIQIERTKTITTSKIFLLQIDITATYQNIFAFFMYFIALPFFIYSILT